jgi:hypothetical protein
MPPGTWLNLAVPGAGLLVRGRVALGLGFILPAIFTLSALVLAHLVATSAALGGWRLGLAAAYALFAAAATGLHAALLRERPLDGEAVRALHRQVAAAHLADRHGEAVAGARRLVAAASGEPGAWRLLALVAEGAGDAATATRARQRARGLEAERER